MPETVVFEHYEVLTRDDGSLYELGRGAMGVTYKAFDTNLRVPVALKVIAATYLDSEVARQRFVSEARSAAKLRHRNVATVYHLGTEGDAWFYAMEFIDGETVESLVRRHGPLEPSVALQLTAQVARALNAAVPHGLVHRDIKPANLMLVREDDELVVKVIDFGLAKSVHAEEDHGGGFVGTPHFASPEQLAEREIDVRSDIYSLGVTLWYMLAGRTPFTGSMAQVKSQHLEQAPPFEQFKDLPAPAAALLRKMLEKDAAQRHQNPQELRRAVEECLAQLTGDEAPAADEAQLTELLDDAQQRAGETQFEPRAVIAGRYRIAESLGETNSGRVFRAYDRERQRDVRLLVLNPDLVADSSAYTEIEREVERLQPVKHDNLLGVYAFETIDGASFLVMEWTDGFSVLDLLRARRELQADETLLLLKQSASGADAALAAGLKRVEFALHQILLHFGQSIDRDRLLRTPLSAWPAFTVKLNPLGITRELSASETWAGAQTMVQGAASSSGDADARPRYVQALGAVAYELLGGTLSPMVLASGSKTSVRYSPLSTLSEQGNEVLKKALDPVKTFPSAEEFFSALKAIEVLEVKRPETRSPATMTSSATRMAPTVAHRTSIPTVPPVKKKRFPIKFIGSLLTVTATGVGIYLLSPKEPLKPQEETPPLTSDPIESTPLVTPPSSDTPPLTVIPPSETPPMSEPAKVEPPQPLRQDQIREALAKAEAIEREGDPARSIQAWLDVAREFHETETPRRRLDFVIDPLRKRPELKKPEAFDALKPLLVEAAQLDALSAVLFLAEGFQGRNVKESFNWYSVAAYRGRTEAFLQMGLILSNGIEGDPQLEKAFYYFQQAAEANDVDAKTALAECYLLAKGTPQNNELGVKWLKEAADQGNLRAMNRLADGYLRGRFDLPTNQDEAFRVWSKVSETKDVGGQSRQPIGEAKGNLGVLYMNGTGTTRDENRAVALFKEGQRLGDPNSTFHLARCYQEGLGGLPKDLDQSTNLARRAAELGSKAARDWCQKNGVIFQQP